MKEGSMKGNRRNITSKRPRIMNMPQKQNIKESDMICFSHETNAHRITVQDLYNEIKSMAIRDGEVSVIDNDDNFIIRTAIDNLIGK